MTERLPAMKLLVPKLLSMGVVVSALLSSPSAPSASAQAEQEIRVTRASKKYDLVAHVKECGGPEDEGGEQETCSGPARVHIYRKDARAPFQTLHLPNVEIYRRTPAPDTETGATPRAPRAPEVYGFAFDDFNFDGAEDVAVCNGRDSAYNGPSYTIFLFNPKARRFVENSRLSALAEGAYLGLFSPDRKRRLLVAQSKSGCCYHETARFKVVGDRPVLVEKITEQATGREDGAYEVVTTTGRRVGRRWVTTVRRKVERRN